MISFFERIFRPIFRGIERKILRPFRRGRSKRRRILRKVQLWFRQMLFLKDPDITYYIKIGRFYIAKKLIAISVLVMVLLIYFLLINPPLPVNNWFNNPNDLRANSAQAEDYTGRANFFDENGERLIYEGRMENGQFSGPGRLFNEDEVLIYEGEFASGEREGRGTEFDERGHVIFEGSFSEGRREGSGTEFNVLGNVLYEGDFAGGERSGRGRQFIFENLVYEGEFAGGRRDGQGILYRTDGTLEYEGEFAGNRLHGEGELYDEEEQLMYAGSFADGVYHGEGTEYFEGSDTVAYEGSFSEGRREGEGRLFFEDGTLAYEGGFESGEFHGDGTAFFEDGETLFEGQFRRGLYHGEGVLYNEAGYMAYEGAFANGEFHGTGTEYSEGENPLYTGEFRNGSWAAIGTLYDLNGEPFYNGYFFDGNIDPEGFLGQNLAGVEELFGDADFLVMDEADLEEVADTEGEAVAAASEDSAAGDVLQAMNSANDNSPDWLSENGNPVIVASSSVSVSDDGMTDPANGNNALPDANGADNGNGFDPQVLADAIREAIEEAIPQEEEEPEWLTAPATAVFNAQQMAFLIEPAEVFEFDTFIKELFIWNQPLVAAIYDEARERYEESDNRDFRFLEISGSTHVVHRGPYRLRFSLEDGEPETLLIEHTCDCQFTPEDRTDWIK